MIREFVDLVNEAVDSGYERGVNMFMENLESDLQKDEIISEQENGVDDVIKHLFISEGYEVEEDLENLDEEKLDEALAALDNEEEK